MEVIIVGGDTEKGANPGTIGGWGEAYEGSIAVEDLLDIEWLGVACAFFCVVGRERGEEFEHSLALVGCGKRNLLASALEA